MYFFNIDSDYNIKDIIIRSNIAYIYLIQFKILREILDIIILVFNLLMLILNFLF